MTLDRLSEASWRVRLSRTRPGLAHLALTDHRSTITADSLESALEAARSLGATRVRTSAVHDASGPTLNAAGFVGVDRLVILRRHLDDPSSTLDAPGPQGAHLVGAGQVRLHRLRRRSLTDAAGVDQAAFGSQWANDRDALADVVAATPQSWGRFATIGRRRRPMVGFVLCGASGRDAYIQRLAVHPAAWRQHVASTLMTAALDWMSAHGSSTVLVNTRPDNGAALALYEQWGFERLRDELIVAEREL